jgi:hypothetical protein
MKLLYLDFPGGCLTGETEDSRFPARFEQTDAFLVLLDGVKILRALMGAPDSIPELSADLSVMLNPLQNFIRKPVHFVVTKWDIIERQHSLGDVAELLGRIEPFSRTVEFRRKLGRATRLIPMSAVGAGFADLQSDGIMKKRENAIAKPFNVDLPISCLLFDLINEAKKNLEEVRNRNFFGRLLFKLIGSGRLLLSVSKMAVEIFPIPAGKAVIIPLLGLTLDELYDGTEKARRRLLQKYGDAIGKSSNEREAFSALSKYHAVEVLYMNRQYPASLLSEYTGS